MSQIQKMSQIEKCLKFKKILKFKKCPKLKKGSNSEISPKLQNDHYSKMTQIKKKQN